MLESSEIWDSKTRTQPLKKIKFSRTLKHIQLSIFSVTSSYVDSMILVKYLCEKQENML